MYAETMGILRNPQSAEDAAQDALVAAYEKLARLRKRERFGPWLLRIARRKAIDLVRNQAPTTCLDQAPPVLSTDPNPGMADLSRQVLDEVGRLPEAEKQAILLKYFRGASVKETAEITGRSVGTVTKQLSRAYAKLRDRLKE